MVIRRFGSRRGISDHIVFDNSKNFIGANRAMDLKFQRNYQLDNGWHHRAVWERLIQTANTDSSSLLIVLGCRKLRLSLLLTFEAEAILKSRLLTHVGCSISDERPLNPNHFILETSCEQQPAVHH